MSIKEELLEIFFEKIKDDFYTGEFITENNAEYKKYHVIQQGTRFEAYLTDAELEETIEAKYSWLFQSELKQSKTTLYFYFLSLFKIYLCTCPYFTFVWFKFTVNNAKVRWVSGGKQIYS